MLPASDDISSGNNMGGPAGGSPQQQSQFGAPTFDLELIAQLFNLHEELCPAVKRWATQQTAVEVLDILLGHGAPLIDALYTRYHDRSARNAEQAQLLQNLFDITCLVVFGLRDMRAAGGKIAPEAELPLYKRLRELDGILEGILPKPGSQQGPGPSRAV